jgi:retron-type reverse transcriptase
MTGKPSPGRSSSYVFSAYKSESSKLGRMATTSLLKSFKNSCFRSKAAKYLAVRQVTQLNQGKATAGIDGKVALNPKERLQLVEQLQSGWKRWQHQKLRRVHIPLEGWNSKKAWNPNPRRPRIPMSAQIRIRTRSRSNLSWKLLRVPTGT